MLNALLNSGVSEGSAADTANPSKTDQGWEAKLPSSAPYKSEGLSGLNGVWTFNFFQS